MKKIQLSDHFSFGRLMRFVMPTIAMMIFTSIYVVVDGLFVSNIVGKGALASINIVMPILLIVGAFGFMLGSGGSAEVGKALGEGKSDKAKAYFSNIILTITVVGVVLSTVLIIYIRPLCYLLGASDLLIEDCVIYGATLLIGLVAFMLQSSFQAFFIVAEKPIVGLILTIAAGLTNILLDFVFIYVLKMGIFGAALATVCGFVVGGVFPLFYFFFPNKSLLRLVRSKFYFRALKKSCINGSSEMLSNISASVVTIIYNLQMMKFLQEDGVSAITVIMYINFIFIGIILGFSMGVAPLISYNYGNNSTQELKGIYKKSLTFIIVASVVLFSLAQILAKPLVNFFLKENLDLAEMTTRGFRLYSFSFLLCGFNIFTSAFFTALCNGVISAIISFMRTLVFQVAALLLLPLWLKVDGIWIAIVVAEGLTLLISIFFILSKRKKYGYN